MVMARRPSRRQTMSVVHVPQGMHAPRLATGYEKGRGPRGRPIQGGDHTDAEWHRTAYRDSQRHGLLGVCPRLRAGVWAMVHGSANALGAE
jgi:hypothetical protein